MQPGLKPVIPAKAGIQESGSRRRPLYTLSSIITKAFKQRRWESHSHLAGYAFRDSDLAARRLALLAETFAVSSATFMRESAQSGLRLAADLGCGPGHSTRLLADTLTPEHAVGLDNSERFLSYARTTASERISFRLHDITTGPFPAGPYDLIFSRLELTHLRDPEAVVELWCTQLRPHGLLLIEEVECIETANEVLSTYLEMQQAMLLKQSNALYIGHRLDAIGDSSTLKRRDSKVRRLQVSGRRAATMFHMNFGVWRHSDFIQRTYEPADLDELEEDLAAAAQGRTDTAPAEWGLRQMVMERASPGT